MTNIRYQSIPIRENYEPMVEVTRFGLLAEPMYFKTGYTTSPHLYLREGLAKLLKDIEAQTFKTHGLRFKIWDPWRPREVQRRLYEKFYNRLKQENPGWDAARLKKETGVFVSPADDERIPPHVTGGTLDLTLCNMNGDDVDMGTAFDHFGPEAFSDYFEKPGRDMKIRDNRRLLRGALCEASLNADTDEWWHYDFGNQKWAFALGRDHAFYGEVADCALEKDGRVKCRFLPA